MRLLVLDAYPREGREALRRAGGTEAGRLYARMLRRLRPDADVDVAHPADADPRLPRGVSLADYDGAAWTGSSLSVTARDDPRVGRQIALARALCRARVPSFGSCFAAQLAVVAAGGSCAPSPKGREFGVARRVRLSAAGRAHPLFVGKPERFDAFTSHADEIVTLPPGARRLAGNDFSRVQAVEVVHEGGRFLALQYHPEYDPAEVAALARLRRDELVDQGTFEDGPAADRFVARLEALARDPAARGAARALGVGDDLLDEAVRTREVRNWLEHEVRRPARARQSQIEP